ncbi:filamentous hemagglutinin N-terminal domain-containing protein [Paraburkholderia sp. MPAMCS5]|uniref:beta strand repeat-containing protein n=1 Tax=Paraburkholderia sp. MPAMCS5 TaxID=3112563 RepID=UPI002E194E08|nr:filamentous hemagglutinin N-terminal domain-containing protein [Paraburkholderia sp. MPAMCS5]
MKKPRSMRSMRALTTAIAVALLFAASGPPSLFANPTGATVVSGTVSVNSPAAGQMNIGQKTPNAIVNWNSFSIGSGEAVVISQPTASSALLNRVTGNDPSVIAGRLQANGKVFLVNPSGVIFAQGSVVNVGSMIASTLNIGDADFLAGHFHFVGASPGPVVNQGSLSAQDGGTIALLGGTVTNAGTVAARLGTVTLGAGSDITLDFAGDGLTTLKINQGVANALLGNTGTLSADGGAVVMSAQSADALAGTVINQQGIVRARSLSERNGHILLDGGASGVTQLSGTLDATGGAGMTGGRVDATGYNVALLDGAHVDASGAAGGGKIRLGGGAGGAELDIRNANAVWMAPTAELRADALANGNGGNVIAYSNTVSRVYGTLSASGGAQGGDGGMIETSGHYLDTTGVKIVASAPKGKGGSWLLDPQNIDIVQAASGTLATETPGNSTTPTMFAPAGTDSQLVSSLITTELNAGTSVTISTAGSAGVGTQAGDIVIMTPITKTATAANIRTTPTLTLSALGSITDTGQNITSFSGPLNVVLQANVNGSTVGAGTVNLTNVSVTTVGGSFSIANNGPVVLNNSSIATLNGAVSISGASNQGTAALIDGSSITTTSGNVAVSGTSSNAGTNSGVFLGLGATGKTSTIATGTGSVSLTGSATGGVATGVTISDGFITTQAATSSNGEGGVSIVGDATIAASTLTSATGVAISNGAKITTNSSPVSVLGRASNQGNVGVSMSTGGSIATTSGGISLNGTADGASSIGVHLDAASLSTQSTTASSGAVNIVASSSGTNGVGFSLSGGSSISTSAGDVGISGTALTNGLFGIEMLGSRTATPTIGTTTGNVNLVGRASGAESLGAGLLDVLIATRSSNAANGAINIQGSTAGDFGQGVALSGAALRTDAGAVNMGGSAAGQSALGAVLQNDASIVTGNGNVAVNGSVSSQSNGGAGVDVDQSSITTAGGNIALTGTSTGAVSSIASVGGVRFDNSSGSEGQPSKITTNTGLISVFGSATGPAAYGILLADGSSIQSVNGNRIELRGAVAGPSGTGSTTNQFFDYGVLIASGSVQAQGSGSAVSITGSTNTADAGLGIGAVPLSANANPGPGAVNITAGNQGSVILRASNDGSTSSLVSRFSGTNGAASTINAPNGTLALAPASVDASNNFAVTPLDATTITLFGTGGGFNIDPATFQTFATAFQTIVLGSSSHKGLITVNEQCPTGSTGCTPVRPSFVTSLTLANPGAGSQGIRLPFGVSLPGKTLTLASAGPVTDPGGIQAAGLLLAGPGTFTLTDPQNQVGVLSMVGAGNVNFLNSGSFVIGPIVSHTFDSANSIVTTIDGTNSTLTGSLVAQSATGNIGLGGGAASPGGPTGGANTNLSAGGSIDLVMEQGVFTNEGSGTLSAGNAWRTWALTWNGETRGNVEPNTAQPNFYGCRFGAGCSWSGTVPATGNHFVYVDRPTVTVTADGKTRPIGAPNPPLTYTVSGLINQDSAAATLSGNVSSAATPASPAGRYSINPDFVSGVGYVVNNVAGTLTVEQVAPVAQSGLQTLLGNDERTFVYENNLQGTNICIGSNQPLFTTAPSGDAQDLLAVEWKRVRSQPNLNSCMVLNGQHGCGDF